MCIFKSYLFMNLTYPPTCQCPSFGKTVYPCPFIVSCLLDRHINMCMSKFWKNRVSVSLILRILLLISSYLGQAQVTRARIFLKGKYTQTLLLISYRKIVGLLGWFSFLPFFDHGLFVVIVIEIKIFNYFGLLLPINMEACALLGHTRFIRTIRQYPTRLYSTLALLTHIHIQSASTHPFGTVSLLIGLSKALLLPKMLQVWLRRSSGPPWKMQFFLGSESPLEHPF